VLIQWASSHHLGGKQLDRLLPSFDVHQPKRY
jgi:hypothetical protein